MGLYVNVAHHPMHSALVLLCAISMVTIDAWEGGPAWQGCVQKPCTTSFSSAYITHAHAPTP
jgi:hypothetical protein